MALSHRLLLFSPLAILTPLFVALGWRNWNLSMSEDEVFAAIAADYRDIEKRATDPISPGRLYIPFMDNEVTIVGRKLGTTTGHVSEALVTRLKSSYPKVRLKNTPPSDKSTDFHFYFEDIQFLNRFHAKCRVSYHTLSTKSVSTESFVLKRSPVNLANSDWYVESAQSSQTLPPGWIIPNPHYAIPY